MRTYNSYHTAVKISYALGLESQMLPDAFIREIPRSTTNDWKDKVHANHFVGGEFASQVEADLEQIKILLDKRLKKMTDSTSCPKIRTV